MSKPKKVIMSCFLRGKFDSVFAHIVLKKETKGNYCNTLNAIFLLSYVCILFC